jgi:hypothetical protein
MAQVYQLNVKVGIASATRHWSPPPPCDACCIIHTNDVVVVVSLLLSQQTASLCDTSFLASLHSLAQSERMCSSLVLVRRKACF